MVVGTVSSAGLPPGWQEVHAEGQVYYWCAFVCLFVSARADFFFLRIGLLFVLSLSLSVCLEPFREEEIEEMDTLYLSLFVFGCCSILFARHSRESCADILFFNFSIY